MNKFLIDECLTPDLVVAARLQGYDATHVAYLGKAGSQDWTVLEFALERDFILVTNNARDFQKLYLRVELHPGVVILLPQAARDRQVELFKSAITAIEKAGDIVNLAVIVSDNGDVSLQPLSRS